MDSRISAAHDTRTIGDRSSARRHWSLEDIPWHAIQHDAVARNKAFFYLVASASLMESATDLYTENLIDFFVDDVSIIPGEAWKTRLESEIRQRDVFLLFWSRHAQESTYVDWEWRTALAAKRDILPQALEPAEVAPPPKELSDLQFGGVYERLISSLRKP